MIKNKTFTICGISNYKKRETIDSIQHSIKKFPFFDKKIFFTDEDGIVDDITLKKIDIKNVKDYNRILVNEFSDLIDTDFVLIVHYDSIIVNPQYWDDEYLDYDYIGAPWPNGVPDPFKYTQKYIDKNIQWQGNGGFCLRSKKFLEVSKKARFELPNIHELSEDVYFSVYARDFFEENGCRYAPAQLARKFSYENKFDETHEPEYCFGIHGKHNYAYISNILYGHK